MREQDGSTDAAGTTPLKVDAVKLRSIAGALSTVSATIGNAHSARKGQLSPAEGAGAGLASLAATRAASLAWYGHLAALSFRVATVGTGLQATVNQFTGVDDTAAAHARRVERELDRQS